MRPVRIDLAKRALRTAFMSILAEASLDDPEANLDSIEVVLADSNAPRRKRPFVLLRLITPPVRVGTRFDERRYRDAPTLVDCVVDSFDVGDTVWARVNGIKVKRDIEAGDTQDSVRDVFVDELASLLGPDSVSVAATGVTGGFSLTPTRTGAVAALDGAGVSFSPTGEVFVEDTVGRRRMSVSCSFVSDQTTPVEDGSAYLADLCYSGIDGEAIQLGLRDARVSVIPISEPSLPFTVTTGGGRIESRSNFDVDLHIASRITRPADYIDTVEVTINEQPAVVVP